MSARRQARARIPMEARLAASGGRLVPAAFLIGRCTEVWATEPSDYFSAMRRFGAARSAWGARAGLDRLDLQAAIPHGGPWSVAYMVSTGSAKQVTERLSRADCTTEDIPSLRAEASALFALVDHPGRKRT